MHRYITTALLFLALASCKAPEARRPVSQSSGSYIDASIERNKKINKTDEKAINDVINQDKSRNYIASDNGFWYTYVVQDSIQKPTPQLGDVVTFDYNLASITGDEVVTQKELGTQTYQIDQSNQELISGLRDGLKLMKEGETVIFLFPSHKAFGYYGYEDKIGANRPIQSTVTLQSIETKTNKDQ